MKRRTFVTGTETVLSMLFTGCLDSDFGGNGGNDDINAGDDRSTNESNEIENEPEDNFTAVGGTAHLNAQRVNGDAKEGEGVTSADNAVFDDCPIYRELAEEAVADGEAYYTTGDDDEIDKIEEIFIDLPTGKDGKPYVEYESHLARFEFTVDD